MSTLSNTSLSSVGPKSGSTLGATAASSASAPRPQQQQQQQQQSGAAASKARPISAQDLRSFYFSRSTNFNAFQTRVQDQSTGSGSAGNSAARAKRNLIPAGSAVRAARSVYDDQPTPGDDDHHQQHQQQQAAAADGHGNAAATTAATTTTTTTGASTATSARPSSALGNSSTNSTGRGRMQIIRASDVHGGDGVSNEYVAFLRDQQNVLKTHQYVRQTVESVGRSIAEHRDAFKQLTDECEELLHRAEESTGWNWRSKFTREQLVHDAALTVPFDDLLRQDDVPNVSALQHLLQNMHKLRHELAGVARQQALAEGGADAHNNINNNPNNRSGIANAAINSNGGIGSGSGSSSAQRFQPFFALLESGTRKVERFISEFSTGSHIDATPIARLPDTLLVQMDNALRIPPLGRILEESLLRLEALQQKREDCIRTRETAIEDGDMDVAEQQSLMLSELSEECTACIQEKIKILERVAEEHAVLQRVCASYSQGFGEAVVALEAESADKKRRCEEDLGRLFALKEKMTTVEMANRDKWARSRVVSDERLKAIDREQMQVWEQLQQLATRFAALEDQRHAECKQRVEAKAEEEGRRNDYDVFLRTLDEYAHSLERTVSNMDLRFVSTQIMADFVRGGFGAIQKDIAQLKGSVEGELFDAHKAHLVAFRNLVFILGELEYRKERKAEEIGALIQNAHIQLELCSDSLNAQAKRFADERNELTRRLHLVEHEVEKLRERQQSALALFAPSSAALHSAGFEHEHPLSELEEWRLETRARMVDYRALAVGGVKSKPLRENLSALTASLEESRSRLFQGSRMSPTQQRRIL